MAVFETRKTNSGKTRYRVKVRLKGFPSQSATFDRLTDAKKWAQKVETEIREGRYFKQSEAKKHTLSECIERYKETVLIYKPKSAADRITQLNWWDSAIGSYFLSDITPSLISVAKDKLAAGITIKGTPRSPATVVRYLAALSHVLTIAEREWEWIDKNPIFKVKKPKEPRGRTRFLDVEETKIILKACRESKNPYLFTIVLIALSTGARKGEILNLRWEDINFENDWIVLQETKNDEKRGIPLNKQVKEELLKLTRSKTNNQSYIFPGQNPQIPIDIRTAWKRALKISGIKDFRFHDLRHTAASHLAMNGVGSTEIAEILGHKSLDMVKRYSHLTQGHKSKVIKQMNDKLIGDFK